MLETFTPDRTSQTAAEIGRRAGLPPSTAHRIVGDLVASGLLERGGEGRIRVGVRLWELATRASLPLRVRQAALPAMERVQARVREHTQLAILEQDEVLFLERLSHPDAGANLTRIAGRLPLHATSSGLVLLAYATPEVQDRVLAGPLRRLTASTPTDPAAVRRMLAEVRRHGHVTAPGYIDEVSTGVAVPVRTVGGGAAAALSVVLPRDAPTAAALDALRHAAREVEAALAPLERRF